MGRNTKIRHKMPMQESMVDWKPAGKGAMWGTKEHGENMKAAAEMRSPSMIGGTEKKYDDGKAPVFRGFIQYFPRAIKSVAMVSMFGAKKYDVAYEEVSYQKVADSYGRYSDADARHLIEECINPVDADSELEHTQMHAWNAMARLEILLKSREKRAIIGADEE